MEQKEKDIFLEELSKKKDQGREEETAIVRIKGDAK